MVDHSALLDEVHQQLGLEYSSEVHEFYVNARSNPEHHGIGATLLLANAITTSSEREREAQRNIAKSSDRLAQSLTIATWVLAAATILLIVVPKL